MAPSGAAGELPTLVLDSVSVRLAGRLVLDDVSLTVGPGQFTGLIGANGAGKTTLLRVVLGLQHPTAGRVRIGGDARKGAVGYVPQKVVLDPDLPMRARDLVELGLDGHRIGIPLRRRTRLRAVADMLDAVGADGFADARVGRLSGGELQRVLIAHALVSRPRLLLLDEPLANLDLRSGHEIVSLLHRIREEQGVAILLSAHEVNPLLPVMDRVVYLADGRAVTGRTDEVIRSDVLSRLYGHHVDVVNVHGRVLVVVGSNPPDGSADHDAVLEVG
jgi:zinc/manganese transport system ATP-binding protein